MWIVNFVYRWYLKIKGKYDRKYQLKCRKLNEKFGLFKVIDLLPVILSISLLVFVLFTMIFLEYLHYTYMILWKNLMKKAPLNKQIGKVIISKEKII